MRGLTTCGHVKMFSPSIVSTHGSSNAHCFANGTMADTEDHKKKKKKIIDVGSKLEKKQLKKSSHSKLSFSCEPEVSFIDNSLTSILWVINLDCSSKVKSQRKMLLKSTSGWVICLCSHITKKFTLEPCFGEAIESVRKDDANLATSFNRDMFGG